METGFTVATVIGAIVVVFAWLDRNAQNRPVDFLRLGNWTIKPLSRYAGLAIAMAAGVEVGHFTDKPHWFAGALASFGLAAFASIAGMAFLFHLRGVDSKQRTTKDDDDKGSD